MNNTQKQYHKGLAGEEAAEAYLASLGMRCLEKRYRGGDGELDLIMQDGIYIAFVEVKSRPTAQPGSGFSAITPSKQKRMLHAAMAYLSEHPQINLQPRFDALEITSGGIRYVPDAFRPSL